MTSRDQHTPGGLTAAVVDLPDGQARHEALAQELSVDPAVVARRTWDELYSSLCSDQRRYLVDLARREGILCDPAPPAPAGRAEFAAGGLVRAQLLSHLLHGKTNHLEPAVPEPVELYDHRLGREHRYAVAAAVSTPDLCLLRGLAGPERPQVLTEVVAQLVARGQRVLLLAPTAAALDAALAAAAHARGVYAIRCVAPGEALEKMPPAVRALTYAERSRILRTRSLDCARRAHAETREQLDAAAGRAELWDRLDAVCGDFARLDEEAGRLDGDAARAPAEVERDAQALLEGRPAEGADPEFAGALAARHREHLARSRAAADRADALRREREQCGLALDELAARLGAVRPAGTAKKEGRWWSPGWWKATLHGGSEVAEMERLEAEQKGLADRLAGLDAEADRAAEEARRADADWAAQLDRLRREEVARRLARLAARRQDLDDRRRALQETWDALWGRLAAPAAAGADRRRAAADGRRLWQQQLTQQEEKSRFLGRWLGFLEGAGDTFADRLPGLANLVAATVDGIAQDERFGDPDAEQSSFDVLLLCDAHLLTEPDLVKVARRAHRWVLVGDGTPPGPAANGKHGGARRPAARPGCFERLWSVVHCDPGRRSYRWSLADGQLCCHLRPVPRHQRTHLEAETLADRPDVELRILNLPGAAPELAEVVFPASFGLPQAKQFIYQELQEAAVQTSAPALFWSEDADRYTVRLTDVPEQHRQILYLEEGLVEHFASRPDSDRPAVPGETARLEFEKAAGWDLRKICAWLAHHLRWHDLGRTVWVP